MKFAWGIILSLLFSITAVGATPATAPTTATSGKAVVIVISGEINEYTQDQLTKRLGNARQLGADTVILQLDTYGGMVSAGLEMSAMLKRQSNLHVIAYVPEKAISAGAMIALACDEIVMGPAAKLGDSAPISVSSDGALQPLPETERAKFESPILEDFRDSAIRHGYDPLLAEAMVSVGRTVYWIENAAGQRKFVTQATYDKLTVDGSWTAVPGVRSPIDSANELLTVSTSLAVTLGLSKGTASSAEDLAQQRNLTILATLLPSNGEIFLRWFSTGIARFVLIVVFIMSLYIALHAPGHGTAEAFAMVSLGLLLGVPLLTGFAQWWEVLMIFVGLAMLAVELFIIPGFGLAGICGISLLVIGFLLTFVPKEPDGMPGYLPSLGSTWTALQNGLIVMVGGMICSLILGAWLRKYLPKLPILNRLILTTPAGLTDSVSALPSTASWPNPGDRGRAVTDLKPGGSVAFVDQAAGDERIVSVVSDRGFVVAGTTVTVQEVGGGRVVVRPV